jgi:hypothetical protein
MKIASFLLSFITFVIYVEHVTSNKMKSKFKAKSTINSMMKIFESLDKYKGKKTDSVISTPKESLASTFQSHTYSNSADHSMSMTPTKNYPQQNSSAAEKARFKSTSKTKQDNASIDSIIQGDRNDQSYDIMNKIKPEMNINKKDIIGVSETLWEGWVKYYTFDSLNDDQLMNLTGKKMPFYANNFFLEQKKKNPKIDVKEMKDDSYLNVPDNSSFYLTLFSRVASISNTRTVSI